MRNIFFVTLFITVASVALITIATNNDGLIYGLHLGDIGYTICVYIVCSFILKLFRKYSKPGALVLSLLVMVTIETSQLLGLGTNLQISQNPLLEFIGKYIFGSKFDPLEILIYLITLLLLDFIVRWVDNRYSTKSRSGLEEKS